MVLNLLIRRLQQGEQDGDALAEDVRRAFMDYLDEQIISDWSRGVQTFLMQLSLVDAFTPELAQAVTGDDDVTLLLRRAEQAGNIFSCTGGEWRIRPVLLETLRRRAVRSFGQRRCNQLMYNAGRYYELSGQTLQALAIYRQCDEQCDEEDGIFSLLVREAGKHAGVGNYWALRQYYQALSDADIQREPVLMTAMSVLYSVLMNAEKSEYWYVRLREYAANAKGNDRSEANAQIAYLDIVLPHRGSKDLVSILKTVSALLRNSGDILRPVSLTNNQPSLMNGGKDFCEWSKRDKELALLIGKPVSMLLGKYGKGLVNEALGESYFEKGTDDFAVHAYLSKAFLEAESNGKIELQFAVVGIQARMNLLNGAPGIARERLESIRKKVDEGDSPALLENMDALGCRISLYENDAAAVEKWMKQAPDEIQEFYTANRYLYMTKLRCYLRRGDYSSALSLAEQLLFYAEQYRRPYLIMETSLLKAVLYRLMGHPWEELFLKTLNMAYEFRFVRIISLEGKAVMPLLKDVKARMSDAERPKKEWFRQIYTEAERMEKLYPEYLTASLISKSDFSEHAVQILKLLDDGMTMKQISEALFLSESTVKYHTVESYRKLGAKGKLDALRKARALEII